MNQMYDILVTQYYQRNENMKEEMNTYCDTFTLKGLLLQCRQNYSLNNKICMRLSTKQNI